MNVLATWNKMSVRPFGKWLFSRAVSFKAPYFASIKPRFEEMKPGYAKVSMKKRRSVENHIGTVHAIACCHLAEVAAGTLLEASLPKTMRWLPRSMNVQYLKKAGDGFGRHRQGRGLCRRPRARCGGGGGYPGCETDKWWCMRTSRCT